MGVIADKAGNLYGTAALGGVHGHGSVFKLAPDGTLTTLYAFTGGSDGGEPSAAPIMDPLQNLYGVTYYGGSHNHGTVYKLAPDGTLTTLYSFTGENDGEFPGNELFLNETGDLYGTSEAGGAAKSGTLFKLTQDGTFTVLHTFLGYPDDGEGPRGKLLADQDGSFYGVTSGGGKHSRGVVYKLAPDGTYAVLHSFRPDKDGGYPMAGLILRGAKLYGTAWKYGPHGQGTVFRFRPEDSPADGEK